jgi:hypothetical protein
LDGEHFNRRKEEREIPKNLIQLILNFNPAEWNLVTVETRNDTGKFVNVTWERL